MRYFLEVAYKGTNYAGFQVQQNANTVQAEVEKALQTCFRCSCKLTGASRTDTGVHAYQNFFHLDVDFQIPSSALYNLNSLLPLDIVIKAIFQVANDFHCRFNALSREYKYYIHNSKNPFLTETSWYYPYKLNIHFLQQAASLILDYTDFTSFSKKNTQAYSNICSMYLSQWKQEGETLVYNVKANRFLRGMVRGLVGTMLRVGREIISPSEFAEIIEGKDCTRADFSAPGKALFLSRVVY